MLLTTVRAELSLSLFLLLRAVQFPKPSTTDSLYLVGIIWPHATLPVVHSSFITRDKNQILVTQLCERMWLRILDHSERRVLYGSPNQLADLSRAQCGVCLCNIHNCNQSWVCVCPRSSQQSFCLMLPANFLPPGPECTGLGN